MNDKTYSIELHENTRVGKSLRIVLGVISVAVTGWFIYSIRGTSASVTTAWIAMGFLFLFGLWLIASGLGFTDRYIRVSDDRIVLRQDFYKAPVVFTATTLVSVRFRPGVIDFSTGERKVRLRLGTYYPERANAITQAVEEFCISRGIDIESDDQTLQGPPPEVTS